MRSARLLAVFLATAALAGCSTGAAVDEVLQSAVPASMPSNETTSSIPRPAAALPGGQIAGVTSDDVAGVPATDTRVADTLGADTHVTEAGMTALADDHGVTSPALQQVALATQPVSPLKSIERRKVYDHNFRDADPVNFGKASPKKLDVHGVDVSRWQGEIDWRKLRTQGANFAYIKATDGGDHLDPKFMDNWRAAEDAGIRRGAYHFFYWCRTASSQADWFIRNVPKAKGALPPVIDVEWNHGSSCKKRPSRELVLEKMQVFMDRLEKHYGQRPIIYTSPDFYADNLRGAFPNHSFWLRSVAAHPREVYPDRKNWVFWQYSGSGLSHGVDGEIDLNAFRGGEEEWHRWVAGATL